MSWAVDILITTVSSSSFTVMINASPLIDFPNANQTATALYVHMPIASSLACNLLSVKLIGNMSTTELHVKIRLTVS